MLDVEAQHVLLVTLYGMDNESPGGSFSLGEVAKRAGLEDIFARLVESVVFQLQKKGLITITMSGPHIMITPEGREAAEQILLSIKKQEKENRGKIGF